MKEENTMKSGYTHISVILDRTGSMEPIRDDIIGGFNSFLEQQKAEPGHATLTLVQFDSEDPYEVIHSFEPLDEIPKLSRETFIPRASTPLFDAVGFNKERKILGSDAVTSPQTYSFKLTPSNVAVYSQNMNLKDSGHLFRRQ